MRFGGPEAITIITIVIIIIIIIIMIDIKHNLPPPNNTPTLINDLR